MMAADFPTGLSVLLDRYDAFVFDLWGVLHNGAQLYPDVLPSLQGLRAAGKKIGILSNSPRPVTEAAKNIAQKFGLTADCYDVLLTSGQLTYEALRDRSDDWLQQLGTRCVTVGPAHEIAAYLALGLQQAKTVNDADFVLCTGLAAGKERVEDYQDSMESWLAAGLRLLCANPDQTVMRGDKVGIAAGAIAAAYRAMGGDVRDHYGKPHVEVFKRMLRSLAVAPARAVMVGDNLLTDIAGAHVAGMRSVWIMGGVHAPELERLGVTSREKQHAYLYNQRAHVNHIMPEVTWS